MAKKKAKKAKGKSKGKPRAKAKARPKTKAKAKPRAKAKPKARAKTRPKPKPVVPGIPITVTPDICDDFTANTGDYVYWQQIPITGCQVTKGNTPWPFREAWPLSLSPVSNTKYTVVAGQGFYQLVVSCCPGASTKTVTVP